MDKLVLMERSSAVVWTCLLGATLTLALPPVVSITTSETDPRPPKLISCVFMNRVNVTCNWEPGDTPATRYTLQVKRIPWIWRLNISSNIPLTTFSCTTSGTSCTAALNGSSVRFTFCIVVTAHCQSGDVLSQSRCQSGRVEVVLPPVSLNSVKPVKERPRCLNVTWGLVILADFPVSHFEIKAGNLTSQIQFTAEGQLDVQVQNVTVRDYSFLVCVFRPDTIYSVRLRHRFMGPMSPWSLWSNEDRGRTGEAAPFAAPAFWRRVKQTDTDGRRLISLLWQPLPRSLASGRVLFYNVTCETQSSEVLNDRGSCEDLDHASLSCSLSLPAGRCSCALTASTSGGTSPETRIWLLGAFETEPPPPSSLALTPLDDGRLDVNWTSSSDEQSSGFVVEWFTVREKNSSILHWERLNSSCTALVITEGVKPLERLAVSVRVLYGERGAGQNRTVEVYTRQGAPLAGPLVEVKQISGSTVELTWTTAPVELLHGFIRNYTLYFKTATRPARSVSVPAHAVSYSLRSLSPGTYDIFMQANTDAGAGAAGPVANVHIGSEEVSALMWTILPLTLTSMMLMLIACLLQTKMVKQKLFQDVPDPSNSSLAHWIPEPTLESKKWLAIADDCMIKHSAILLLGERELLNANLDEGLTYKSVCNLQTYSYTRYSQLPVLGAQTLQNDRKSTSNTDLPSVYSDVLISQMLQSLPKPLVSPSDLRFNEWRQRVSDMEPQLEGDSDLDRGASKSELSQIDDLKIFCHLQRQSQSPDSSSISHSSSVWISHPPNMKSPQHPLTKYIYNSVPPLQRDALGCSDAVCDTVSLLPFPGSIFVDFSYSPVEYDCCIPPAV
ncbi:interleukin-6 receptor subunit beta isoform X1 [Xyrichtys novacula]|uniref:Interleukin-6 receptor subunit beta isoform X1 n=1 Tax=Xyrichtys novacula TaxID=13765 RepID=A0AAV1GNM9_XYRNO|nr:interleukin-6 receptor subunit beta isoform X1 [Xyrichtys novacula]